RPRGRPRQRRPRRLRAGHDSRPPAERPRPGCRVSRQAGVDPSGFQVVDLHGLSHGLTIPHSPPSTGRTDAMSAPTTAAELLDLVRKSHLLDPAKLARYAAAGGPPDALAAKLQADL